MWNSMTSRRPGGNRLTAHDSSATATHVTMNGIDIRTTTTTSISNGRSRYEIGCTIEPNTQIQLVAADGEVVVRWSADEHTLAPQVLHWTDDRADLVARVVTFGD
jgi:hypothetical protein